MAQSERIEFTGSQGDVLAARLERPAGPARAFAIFAHCFSCSKDILAASRVSRRLAAQGIAVLRFDFTGLGHSQGDFANTNFSSNIEDLVRAADYLAEHEQAPRLLVGHSLGGAAVIVAAAQIPSVTAVATLGAPSDAEHVKHQFDAHLDEIEETGVAQVKLAGRPFTIKKQFLDDIAGHSVEAAAEALKRPLMIAHAPMDATVSIENASRLFLAAKHPKTFLSLDEADHLLTRGEDADYAGDMIAAWAGRYIDDGGAVTPPRSKTGQTIVQETGKGRYQNIVVDGDHILLADEPRSVGGDDSGPTPYGYLNAALGACTSMTMRMYANRKNWPLDKITVSVSHEKGHAEDCEDCVEGQDKNVDIFEREIRIEGDLDEAQRARLMEMADRCPVHRTLHSPVVIRTRSVD